jgi:Flp pilus assembly protein TadG
MVTSVSSSGRHEREFPRGNIRLKGVLQPKVDVSDDLKMIQSPPPVPAEAAPPAQRIEFVVEVAATPPLQVAVKAPSWRDWTVVTVTTRQIVGLMSSGVAAGAAMVLVWWFVK